MKRSRAVFLALSALAALALLLNTPSSTRGTAPEASPALRLAAPLVPLAANVQWVRVDAAMREGRPDKVLARADALLALDAHSGDAQSFLSSYFGLQLASPEREPDAARRVAWLRVALDYAAHGERHAERPWEFALWQGELLARAALVDPATAWPGGVRALWSEAAAHFERGAAGHPIGHARAAECRAALETLR
jgi:hypothetical protein